MVIILLRDIVPCNKVGEPGMGDDEERDDNSHGQHVVDNSQEQHQPLTPLVWVHGDGPERWVLIRQ